MVLTRASQQNGNTRDMCYRVGLSVGCGRRLAETLQVWRAASQLWRAHHSPSSASLPIVQWGMWWHGSVSRPRTSGGHRVTHEYRKNGHHLLALLLGRSRRVSVPV